MFRRKRDHTFILQEKVMLLELIENNLNVIENKNTDTKTNKYKYIIWNKIAEEFNAHTTIHHRSWQSLKQLWINMKLRAKEEQKTLTRSLDNLDPGNNPPKLDALKKSVLDLVKKPIQEHLNMEEVDKAIAAYDSIASTSMKRKVNESKRNKTDASNASRLSTSGKEKTRDSPFVEPELLLLLGILEKNLDIIDSKNCDTKTNKRKISKWMEIAEEFNVLTTIQTRHWHSLKRCWLNLKSRANGGRLENGVVYNRVKELMQRPIRNSVDVDMDDNDNSNYSYASNNSEASQTNPKRIKINESCANVEDLVEVLESEVEISNDSMNYSPHEGTPEREDGSSTHLDPLFGVVKEEPVTSPRPHRLRISNLKCIDDKNESQNIGATDKGLSTEDLVSYSEEEHKQQMQILKLQLEKEKTILKNETLKTEILKLQTKKEQEFLNQELLKTQQEEIKLALLKKQLLD